MRKIKTKKDLKGLHVSIPCPPLDILQNFTNTGSLSFSKYKSFCFIKNLLSVFALSSISLSVHLCPEHLFCAL